MTLSFVTFLVSFSLNFLMFFLLKIKINISSLKKKVAGQSKNYDNLLVEAADTADFVDFMLFSLQIGVSARRSFEYAVQALRSGSIKQSATLVLSAMQLGQSFSESLKIGRIKSKKNYYADLLEILIVAQQMGTDLETCLKKTSIEMRNYVCMVIEERAAKTPIYMMFVLVIFFLPSIFVLLGSAALKEFLDSLAVF